VSKVYLHIGTRKSGTSYLQKALRESASELTAQGVDLTFRTRKGHVDRQLQPLKEFAATGDEAAGRAAIEPMLRRIAAHPELTHLVTLEDLAELPQSVADLYVGALADHELHLVVTARHWGATIPSEWQQCVKERDTRSYEEFVREIQDGAEGATQFLERQDLPQVVQRWGGSLAPERIHVIAVPPSSRTEEGSLVHLFCGLIGVDPGSLRLPKGAINASISLDQAELLRRVNIELGDRLPFEDGSYQVGIREWLTRGTLMKHYTSPIRIPEEASDWCLREIKQQYDGLVALGVDLVGDPDDLLPTELQTGPSGVSDLDVLDQALTALADLGALQWKEQRQLRRLQEENAALKAAPVEPPRAEAEGMARVRASAGAVRSRAAAGWLGLRRRLRRR
jgi:hypothetical protein